MRKTKISDQGNAQGDNMQGEYITSIKDFTIVVVNIGSFQRQTESDDMQKFSEMIRNVVQSTLEMRNVNVHAKL